MHTDHLPPSKPLLIATLLLCRQGMGNVLALAQAHVVNSFLGPVSEDHGRTTSMGGIN